jgi:hypothetical protein
VSLDKIGLLAAANVVAGTLILTTAKLHAVKDAAGIAHPAAEI